MVEISLENPAIKGFIFYSTLVIVKMIMMAFLTARQRFRKEVTVFIWNT